MTNLPPSPFGHPEPDPAAGRAVDESVTHPDQSVAVTRAAVSDAAVPDAADANVPAPDTTAPEVVAPNSAAPDVARLPSPYRPADSRTPGIPPLYPPTQHLNYPAQGSPPPEAQHSTYPQNPALYGHYTQNPGPSGAYPQNPAPSGASPQNQAQYSYAPNPAPSGQHVQYPAPPGQHPQYLAPAGQHPGYPSPHGYAPQIAAPYGYPQDQTQYTYASHGQANQRRGNGPGITSLIIGILSILIAVLPALDFNTFLLGLIGVIFGVVGMALPGRPRQLAVWGTVLSATSMFLSTFMTFVYVFAGVAAGRS